MINKNKSHPGKAGRPNTSIDYDLLESLCEIQCTRDEVLHVMKVSVNTLNKRIGEHYKDDKGKPLSFITLFAKFSAEGKASLRRYQFETARKSPVMQIWLGKNWLGQSDKADLTDRIISLEKFAKALTESTTIREDKKDKEKTLSQYGNNNKAK